MAQTRREFLAAGLGLTLGLGVTSPALFGAGTKNRLASRPADPLLVVVELKGGNDGLNTVVPCGQGAYYDARPHLALKEDEVLPLAGLKIRHESDYGGTGLHPAAAPLYALYQRGELALLPAVGMTGSSLSRSHVRASQIWHSGRPDIIGDTGWLGRYLDEHGSGRSALVDAGHEPVELPLALIGKSGRDIVRLDPASCKQSDLCGDSRLGRSLALIADSIATGSGETKIFYTAMDGFDTHASQAQRHDFLLRRLAQALAGFFEDLKKRLPDGLDQRVLVLVHSEFGRRLQENSGSLYADVALPVVSETAAANVGTDHGGSGLCMVLGPAVRGGVYGGYPDLSHLQDAEFSATVDFRTVYATILENWLQCDSRAVLGGKYPLLDFC
ncbi:MAG: DUF1501 domain-containing protein [Cyanobacteria bacterium SZAS LIN-3]|nr:DUF1501 domain-containing protein [Cyanobacteria bacterium SZAS LIN-3]